MAAFNEKKTLHFTIKLSIYPSIWYLALPEYFFNPLSLSTSATSQRNFLSGSFLSICVSEKMNDLKLSVGKISRPKFSFASLMYFSSLSFNLNCKFNQFIKETNIHLTFNLLLVKDHGNKISLKLKFSKRSCVAFLRLRSFNNDV